MGYLKSIVRLVIPPNGRRALARFWFRPFIRQIVYFGFPYYCPICRRRIHRLKDYSPAYRNVECPHCNLHPRHRLMWLYLTHGNRRLIGSAPLNLLHFAPEPAFTRLFQNQPNITYLSADISPQQAMVQMDIRTIPVPDESFDAIFCSHVLEHVDDDRSAMRELLRVLRPGGWAILQVPIDVRRKVTLEDPAIQSPGDRERHYWQSDHVRLYGTDYQERLESVGFKVTVDRYALSFSEGEIRRFGLERGEGIYLCTRP